MTIQLPQNREEFVRSLVQGGNWIVIRQALPSKRL